MSTFVCTSDERHCCHRKQAEETALPPVRSEQMLADAIAAAVVQEFHICETANPDGQLRRLPDEQARAEIAGIVQIVSAANSGYASTQGNST